MQKATNISLALCITLLGTTISGCAMKATTTQDQSSPVSVQTSQAAKGWLGQGPLYIGTVQPENEVDVVPKMAGKIASVNVSVGSHVKKGDILYQMDDKDVRNTVAQAQAAVASAEANVQTAITQQQSTSNQASSSEVGAKGSVIQAQNALAAAQNGLVQAQNKIATSKQAFDDATTNKQRYEQLYAANAASKAQLDQAQKDYINAQADYTNAQKGLETAQTAVAVAQQALSNAANGFKTAQNQVSISQSASGVEASRQVVGSAQAALKTAQDQLADTSVISPIDGVVGIKNIEVGNFLNPNFPSNQPTLVIANLDPAKVLVYIPASEINRVKVGDPVMIRAVSLNEYLQGAVKSISPLDKQGKGYPVEISIPNPNLVLKKGMVAEVSFIDKESKQGMIIPTSAVVRENEKTYVFVAGQNVAKRVEIAVGGQQGSQTLVTSGINEKDMIITSQANLLHDQEKIVIDAKN
jgi:HlyD family secretion protein